MNEVAASTVIVYLEDHVS